MCLCFLVENNVLICINNMLVYCYHIIMMEHLIFYTSSCTTRMGFKDRDLTCDMRFYHLLMNSLPSLKNQHSWRRLILHAAHEPSPN